MPSAAKDTAPTKVMWEGGDIEHADLEGGYAVCLAVEMSEVVEAGAGGR